MDRPDRTPARLRLALSLALALTGGCGARSALREPPAPDTAVTTPDASDAARDGPPPDRGCQAQRECDDGVDCTEDICDRGQCLHAPHDERCTTQLFCAGPGRCDLRAGCVSTPPSCDDGIPCTVDSCDDRRRDCAHDPNDELCPISHRCVPGRGCISHALAHSRQTLIEVELPGGAINILAHTSATLTDIALAPDRTLYGIAHGQFYRVDEHTGEATLIAAVDGDYNGLDAAPDGTLYGSSSDGIFKLDPATGAAAMVSGFPPGLEASGDLAFLGDRMLATARTGPGSLDQLVEVDVSGGTSRVLGPIGYACVWGLAAFGPTLYGLTCNGEVLRIDPATGAASELSHATAMFYGATAR